MIIPEQRKAKLWINNQWVYFTLVYGRYTNIITFLDSHDLSFIKINYIDFNQVPITLHGFGNSINLMNYLSNNEGNNVLINKFIDYFLKELNFKFTDNSTATVLFEPALDWRDSNVVVPYSEIKYFTVDTTYTSCDTILISADKTIDYYFSIN